MFDSLKKYLGRGQYTTKIPVKRDVPSYRLPIPPGETPEWIRVAVGIIKLADSEYFLSFEDGSVFSDRYLYPESQFSLEMKNVKEGDSLRIYAVNDRNWGAAPRVLEIWQGEEPLFPYENGEFKPFV